MKPFFTFLLTFVLGVLGSDASAQDVTPKSVLDLSTVNDEPNPILIPEINAEIRYGEKAGSYWWGGKKEDGQGSEIKHNLEIKLKGGTYVIRPEFSKDYDSVSPNLRESEISLDDHLVGLNYGYNKGLLVLQGSAQGASSPYIEWLVMRLTKNGKRFSSMVATIPSCMGSSIPALWEPGEVEYWNYDLGYSEYKAIEIVNRDADSAYEIKTYHGPGALLDAIVGDMKITDYPFEFFEISRNGTVRVDNNPSLYKPYFEQEKYKGNTWKAFYYGVRAGVVRVTAYKTYGISQEKAESFDKDIHRDCTNYQHHLHQVTSGSQK